MSRTELSYLYGFGNNHQSEAVKGALPVGQNSPQQCPFGLFAEQINGTAFTAPRHENLRTWMYRLAPSVVRSSPFREYNAPPTLIPPANELLVTPNQLRWDPLPLPSEGESRDFIDGLCLFGASGDPAMRSGLSIYMYSCNASMSKRSFYSSDGDILLVPQVGTLHVRTELGVLTVEPNEICVLPRGFVAQINLEGVCQARGYMLEVFDGHFELPELGPIGANGLANPQDFAFPQASYIATETESSGHKLLNKFMGRFFEADIIQQPFNVVAWRGNYAPFKYDLRRFNTINTVSFDHPDPSIFTVLTCKSSRPGTAIADFVVFPPRWAVAEHTFRPPYFHRNAMTEFMGLIIGDYDAKQGGGFVPGGASLHSLMTPHGPDATTYEAASKSDLKPAKVAENSMAFMFESSLMLKVPQRALFSAQAEYHREAWIDIKATKLPQQ